MAEDAAPSQAVAAKKPVSCEECGKNLSSKQSLMNHVMKLHKKVVDAMSPLIQSTSRILTQSSAPASSPAPPSTPAPALPGPSTTATPATTPASMAAPASKPRQLFSPGTEESLEDETEVMEEAKEEQDLYDALDLITQNVIDPVTEKDTRDGMKLKLLRYKNIMNKKTDLIKEMSKKMNSLEHEARLGNQVADQQRIDLEKEESEKNILKSQVKKAEKEHENSKSQHKKNVDLLRETLNQLTKENNDLKEKAKTRDSYVAAMTEELTGGDDDENEDAGEHEEVEVSAEVHRDERSQRVTMTKKNTPPKCHACDKMFKADGDLEKHMSDVHTPSECDNCNKKFKTKRLMDDHICAEGDIVPQKCEKSYCNKEFVSSATLKKHMKNTHFGAQRTVCNNCGELISKSDIKEHNQICHNDINNVSHNQERSKEVCKHWKRGKCTWAHDAILAMWVSKTPLVMKVIPQ